VEAGVALRAEAERDDGGRGGTSAADGMVSSKTSTAAMDKPIPSDATHCHVVLTTLPSREAAATIARALIEARLAACVQLVDGLRSIYRWQGRVEESAEVQLIAKTTPAASAALIDRLRALHPYDVPEILTLDATASAAYAAWLRDETGG
jgi:periplasmic divalent cation tolerance protein